MMKDKDKTKEELIIELEESHEHIAELRACKQRRNSRRVALYHGTRMTIEAPLKLQE
jgi:hypothetical protein